MYIPSRLVKEYLGILKEELDNMSVEKAVWAA